MSYYPDASFTNPFSTTQWRTLLAIADTFLPALSSTDALLLRETVRARIKDPDWDAIEDYIRQAASEDEEFTRYLQYAFDRRMPAAARVKIAGLCDVLAAGGIKTYLMTGYRTPFPDLSVEDRTAVLLGWRNAYLPMYRKLFRALQSVVMSTYLRASKTAHKAMGYIIQPEDPGVDKEEFWEFEFEEFQGEEAEMDVDAVVVGSGSGGGVVAARLAEAGLNVVVVEKGRWFKHSEFPFTQLEGVDRMYEGGAALVSADGNGALVAGSVWGGGTTVNWSACLQIGHHVRQEWSSKFGLKFAATPDFQECLDSVYEAMGVTEDPVTTCRHSVQTQKLLRGAHLAGYRAAPLPRNTGGHPHFCGSCMFGCPSGGKRGGTITYLVHAQKAGAKCIQSCHVNRILMSGNRAVGITATVTDVNNPSHKTALTIKAKRVIISAGALHTPCLLARSGLTNPHLGSHLRVHPTAQIFCQFDNEVLNSWEGPILSAAIFDLENLSGDFYGPKLMATAFHPLFCFSAVPWKNSLSWRTSSLFFKSGATILTILRERESEGTVIPDPVTGAPIIRYTFAKPDRERLLAGTIASIECMVAAGADEVFTMAPGQPSFRVDKSKGLGIEEAGFKEWKEGLRKGGWGENWTSAHQMGTARMSASAEMGVCDTKGRVWGREGLYVADGSLFPTASGVNPMVTIMALAEWVAKGIVEEVRTEGKE